MNVFKKCINGSVIAALFVSLSLPVQAQNYNMNNTQDTSSCCPVCPTTDPCDPCFQMPCENPRGGAGMTNWGFGLGGLAIGLASGIGIGYAIGDSNDHCCKGYRSSCKPSCTKSNFCSCKKIEDGTLCFRFFSNDFIISAEINGFSGEVTPIMTTPEGCTIKGTPVPFLAADNESFFSFNNFEANVSLCKPACGTYQIGLEVEADTLISVSSMNMNVQASSNCIDCTSTALAPISISGVTGEETTCVQLSTVFSFAPDCCVVAPSCLCTPAKH